MDRFSGLYLGALFVLIFGLWTPDLFLTSGTLHSVASNQAIGAMLALAVLIPMAGGCYDLSVGAVAGISTVIVVTLQSNHGWSMGPAILVTVVIAAVAGLVNGFVVVKLRVDAFIATLGTATIIAAFQTIISDGAQPPLPRSPGWRDLTQQTVFGFQIVVIYLLLLTVLVWWVLEHTPAGRYIYAIGGNEEAAHLSGVAVGRWRWMSMIASAAIAGIAGVLYGSLTGPSLTYGPGLLLPAFAAAFLGTTQVRPGRPNAWGTLLAVYVLAIGVKGMQLVTGVQWLNDMFNGGALILAVAFAVWRQRRPGANSRKAGARPLAPARSGSE
ncbi:ABC transporter permease [Acrocarpospora macrocephala]|uniref:Sugar ABC transporter permease n=1 Tax=Acrocarpospora macrocephala TaxID=150177 RepID=A0A5M3WIF7_9ACTN|nr:ABC transporter permease [Acrocarpospora macrocephala]GES08486.1 sugar ABC transporter permease [Acrocarpospora macrocephala]